MTVCTYIFHSFDWYGNNLWRRISVREEVGNVQNSTELIKINIISSNALLMYSLKNCVHTIACKDLSYIWL